MLSVQTFLKVFFLTLIATDFNILPLPYFLDFFFQYKLIQEIYRVLLPCVFVPVHVCHIVFKIFIWSFKIWKTQIFALCKKWPGSAQNL